jgi:predicted nucleotidyltransferase
MVIHRPYDEVLRSWSHVAVLRALLDSNVGLSGNEVGRMSGMQPRSALKALSSLEELGIVRRQRGGRDHLFTLNRSHHLVSEGLLPLYGAEISFQRALEESLSSILSKRVLSAIIFGSVVRNQETAQSDLDLFCLVKSDKKKEEVRQSLMSAASALHSRFGVKLAPLFFTVAELKKNLKSPFIKQMLKEGKPLVGELPRGIARGQTRKKIAR